MNLMETAQLLGNSGEFFGAIAVVVTLGYLTLQIRQNTLAMQSTAEVEAARHWSEQNIRAALEPDMTRIMDIGTRDATQLNDDERRRFLWFTASHFYMVDGLFKLYQKGQLSEEAWLPFERQIRGVLNNEPIQIWWNSRVSPVSDAFRTYFDDLVSRDEPLQWELTEDMARMFDPP